jgi:hypothetical protein
VDVPVAKGLWRKSSKTDEVCSSRHDSFAGAQPFQDLDISRRPGPQSDGPTRERLPGHLNKYDRPASVIYHRILGNRYGFGNSREKESY